MNIPWGQNFQRNMTLAEFNMGLIAKAIKEASQAS